MDTNTAGYSLGYGLGQLLGQSLGFLLVGMVIALVVFLVVRWFWLWYWRVNTQVALLQEIVRHLQLIEEQGRPLPPGVTPPAGSAWERPADWLPTARG